MLIITIILLGDIMIQKLATYLEKEMKRQDITSAQKLAKLCNNKISPDFINKMIAKFKKKQDKHLVLADKKGQKTNPVIWSKSLYNVADLAAENADLRPIFLEHADYTTSVKATNDELLDVNFQHDLEVAQKLVKG